MMQLLVQQMAVSGYNSGSGKAALFQVTEATNSSEVLYANTYGTGPVASFEISNTSSTNSALYTKTLGTGNAAHIDGKMKITDGTEGAGKVLTSDASGNASWRSKLKASAGGTSSFSFTSDGAWRQFSDLTLTFSLANAADVMIVYNLTATHPCGGSVYMATRVLIDGVETTTFRSTNEGVLVNANNSNTGVVSLSSGSHTVVVQYRTNMCPAGNNNNPGGSDYQTRMLLIKEL
jgi:hypothetical protein